MLMTVNNISKSIANKPVIHDVSFSIEQGEFIGLIGKNGVGKSTLIKLLSGIILPDSGEVIITDSMTKSDGVLGYVPQEIYLPDNITIKELILNEAILKGVIEEKAYEAIQLAQLEKKMNTPINKLTTGEKRKLIILKAVINSPKILLLDEPFVGIDPINRMSIINYLQALKQKGTGCVISSHYLNDLEQLCQKFITLRNENDVPTYKVINNTNVTDKNTVMITIASHEPDIIEHIIHQIGQQISTATFLNKENKIFISCHEKIEVLINLVLLFFANNETLFNSIILVQSDIIEYL